MDKRHKGTDKRAWRGNHWILIIGGILVVVAVHSLLVGQPRETLDYGRLIREIPKGSILYAKLGPSEIEGRMLRDGKEVPFRTPRRGAENHQQIYELLQQHNVQWTAATDPSGLQAMLIYLLPTAVVVGILIFMMRRMGGGGSAMAFARSRARLYGQDDVEVTFNDVAGIDEAVDEVRELADFLKSPEKYQSLGGRIPKGVLLVGPPGTGKTLLARAVAGEAGVPFFSLSGSDFVEMFVGVGAARARDLFQQAQQKAPCIVFIDELDALGKTRGANIVGGHDEREQTLNQLLVEMDGFDANRGVIVMAATNRPETLDPALLRPGRFDRHVVVDRPDINGREAILRVHARNVKLSPEVDLRAIGGLTPGFVGADLANLMNEAALLAARAGRSEVTRVELEAGIERVIAGSEKKRRVMLPEEKRRIAVHESGHAVVAALLPNTDPVHKVSIIPRGIGALGYTLQRPEDDRYLATQSELESRVQVLLGGNAAEQVMLGETSSGAQNDLERATAIARQMVTSFGMSTRLGRVSFSQSPSPFLNMNGNLGDDRQHSEQTAREIDEEIRQIIHDAAKKAHELLVSHRPHLEEVTRRLMEKEVIDGAELREVLQGADAPVSVGDCSTTAQACS